MNFLNLTDNPFCNRVRGLTEFPAWTQQTVSGVLIPVPLDSWNALSRETQLKMLDELGIVKKP